MEPTRREFMRQVGVFLVAFIASGCQTSRTPQPTSPPMPPTCYQPTAVPVSPTPTALATDPHWNTLRASWLELNNPQLQSYEDTDFSRRLRQQHRKALAALTEAGQIDRAVAVAIQVAFDQAMAHIQRQQVTCYIALPPEYAPRQDVMTQAAALTEMAQRSKIDPTTVERARAALARDMAWLAQFQVKQQPDDLADIQATATEIKAARILVDLLATAD